MLKVTRDILRNKIKLWGTYKLLAKILNNSHHFLQTLLPPPLVQNYNIRHRKHKEQLPARSSAHLTNCNLIKHMLFRDNYWLHSFIFCILLYSLYCSQLLFLSCTFDVEQHSCTLMSKIVTSSYNYNFYKLRCIKNHIHGLDLICTNVSHSHIAELMIQQKVIRIRSSAYTYTYTYIHTTYIHTLLQIHFWTCQWK